MSRVEKIEAEVQQMTAAELEQFRAWFAEFEADVTNRKLNPPAAVVSGGDLNQ